MNPVLYCLVDPAGHVHLKAGVASYADAAHGFGLDEERCEKYRFDLNSRRFVADAGTAAERAARDCIEGAVGTPERLMKFAGDGALPKDVLAALLAVRERQAYLAACAAIEQQYTDACGSSDPCLPGGCAAAGETCLQPIVRREREYQMACGAEWAKRFAPLGHRIEVWKQ